MCQPGFRLFPPTVWLDREEFQTIQIRFFDRGDAHLTTMVVEDYRKYLDRF